MLDEGDDRIRQCVGSADWDGGCAMTSPVGVGALEGKANGPGASAAGTPFRSTRSRNETRASLRSGGESGDGPTDNEVTWAAPSSSSTATNPGVDPFTSRMR